MLAYMNCTGELIVALCGGVVNTKRGKSKQDMGAITQTSGCSRGLITMFDN